MNIFYTRFIFYYCQQVLLPLRAPSLLSPLNDASADIVDDEGSSQLCPDVEFTPPSYVHFTLVTDTETQPLCFIQLLYCVKDMLKLLAFKWLLNELSVEIE